MKPAIRLALEGNTWFAYWPSVAVDVIELFGSNRIPTPFGPEFTGEEVRAEIAKNFPEYEITSRERHERLAAAHLLAARNGNSPTDATEDQIQPVLAEFAAHAALVALIEDHARQLDSMATKLATDSHPAHCDYISKARAAEWCAVLVKEARAALESARQ